MEQWEKEEKKFNKHFDAEIAKSDALDKGLVKGKIFNIGVADGYSYYEIVKVNKTTVRIKWREDLCCDKYQYYAWGEGCNVPIHLVEHLITAAENLTRIARRW